MQTTVQSGRQQSTSMAAAVIFINDGGYHSTQRRSDSPLGESGRISRPIRLRHFPHARARNLCHRKFT